MSRGASRAKALLLAMVAATSAPAVSVGTQDSKRTAQMASMGRPDLSLPGSVLFDPDARSGDVSSKSNRISQAKRRKLRRRTNGRYW